MVLFFICVITLAVFLTPHLIYALLWLLSSILRTLSLWPQLSFNVHYKPFGIAATVMVVLWISIFTWGHYWGRFFHEIRKSEITLHDLPESFDKFRIVHISDLHLDGYAGHEKELNCIIDEINALNADVIVFTGDLVSLSKNEIVPFTSSLKRLHAKHGVFSIMGNHDYIPYNKSISEKERAKEVSELQKLEKEELGWKLLLNENYKLSNGCDSIAIIGCENQSMGVHSVIVRGDLSKAMKGTEDMTKIILTHDPTHWKGEIINNPYTKNSLTLSGHTHSGQFKVLGLSAAAFIYDEYDGLYSEGNRQLYVNIGLGGTMPMRIGAIPEVTLHILKCAK